MAFVIAALVEIVTISVALLALFGSGMSDDMSAGAEAANDAKWIFICGSFVAALISFSHFKPIGW